MNFVKTFSVKNIFFIIAGLGCITAKAQITDLARIEYTFIPQAKSDNSINRFRGFVNFPIELDWEGSYIIPSIEYRNFDIDLEDPLPFDVTNLEQFQMFRMGIVYTFKIKNNWRIGLQAGAEIASNFELRTVKDDDMRFSGAAYLIKDRTADSIAKPNRLIIGLQYTTNAGRPFPIPIINYYRKFHPNWSYSIGTPKTNLKHYLNEKQTLQGFFTLDGFFSNLQNDLPIPGDDNSTRMADNISMTIVLGGVGYEYNFTRHILFYFYGGYTIFNEIRLRDNRRNSLYKVNEENTFYLRSGFKLKI